MESPAKSILCKRARDWEQWVISLPRNQSTRFALDTLSKDIRVRIRLKEAESPFDPLTEPVPKKNILDGLDTFDDSHRHGFRARLSILRDMLCLGTSSSMEIPLPQGYGILDWHLGLCFNPMKGSASLVPSQMEYENQITCDFDGCQISVSDFFNLETVHVVSLGELEFDVFMADDPMMVGTFQRPGYCPTSKEEFCLINSNVSRDYATGTRLFKHGGKEISQYTCTWCLSEYCKKTIAKYDGRGNKNVYCQREVDSSLNMRNVSWCSITLQMQY